MKCTQQIRYLFFCVASLSFLQVILEDKSEGPLNSYIILLLGFLNKIAYTNPIWMGPIFIASWLTLF